jgi:HPt (histidine-containing phosphotransfer) domain-containing protein
VNPSSEAFDREEFSDRVMGNEALARRILRGFVNDMPRQFALLAQALSEGDAGKVRLAAHSIKGAAASVSGREIREVSGKLEQQAKTGNLSGVDAALAEISASFERARTVMEDFCDEDPPLT